LLRRRDTRPVKVSFAIKISPRHGSLPQLQRLKIEINRYGKLDARGLPICRLEQIQPTTNADALRSCRPSRIAKAILIQGDLRQFSAFPLSGQGARLQRRVHGHPAILAHVFGENPLPLSCTIIFLIGAGQGRFGTTLSADLRESSGTSGYIAGLSLTLGRHYQGGHSGDYLSASCPTPKRARSLISAGTGKLWLRPWRDASQHSDEHLSS
jgi:hypothetical protein